MLPSRCGERRDETSPQTNVGRKSEAPSATGAIAPAIGLCASAAGSAHGKARASRNLAPAEGASLFRPTLAVDRRVMAELPSVSAGEENQCPQLDAFARRRIGGR